MVLLVSAALAVAHPAMATALPGGASALSEKYGDWQVNCVTSKSTTTCAISQVRADPKTHKRLLAVEVRQSGKDSVDGTLLMPFGLALTAGVVLNVDQGNESAPLGFTTCLPAGCIVPFKLRPDVLKALSAGAILHIRANANDTGKPIRFAISLKGFSAAFARLSQLAK